jgi:hypothetical protein
VSGEVVQFVDAVSDTANIRLSLTTAPWSVLISGTDISPPDFSRVTVGTYLSDGNLIPASSYGNRNVTLHLQLDVNSSNPNTTAATMIQALGRELDRPTNILRWQPDHSLPAVYFRTYRSPDYTPTFDYGISLYDFSVVLLAEPFALGPQQNITTQTINFDPAQTNGMYFDVVNPMGDVEAPLYISVAGNTIMTSNQTLFACRRRGTPANTPFLLQAEVMTMGTGATTIAGGTGTATASGTGNNVVNIDTNSNNTDTVNRVSTTAFPPTPGPDVRGTYRVFARVSTTTVSAVYSLQLTHGAAGIVNTANVITPGIVGYMHADLGLVQMPEGFDPITNGPSGSVLSVNGVALSLQAHLVSGSGTLHLDYFLFVPADDKLSIVSWSKTPAAFYVFDGTQRSLYALDSSLRVADIQPATYVGDPPAVLPNATTRVYMIPDVTPNALQSTDVALPQTFSVNAAYWPRYLTVRPLTT